MYIYEPNVALELAKRRAAEMRADAEHYRLARRTRLARRARARGGRAETRGASM